jgi:DNA-binding PadR family transcriptional regulator
LIRKNFGKLKTVNTFLLIIALILLLGPIIGLFLIFYSLFKVRREIWQSVNKEIQTKENQDYMKSMNDRKYQAINPLGLQLLKMVLSNIIDKLMRMIERVHNELKVHNERSNKISESIKGCCKEKQAEKFAEEIKNMGVLSADDLDKALNNQLRRFDSERNKINNCLSKYYNLFEKNSINEISIKEIIKISEIFLCRKEQS